MPVDRWVANPAGEFQVPTRWTRCAEKAKSRYGRRNCKGRFVFAIRVMAQVACRALERSNPALAQMSRAYNGGVAVRHVGQDNGAWFDYRPVVRGLAPG